jgi:uncharacterized membrane-anchored protein
VADRDRQLAACAERLHTDWIEPTRALCGSHRCLNDRAQDAAMNSTQPIFTSSALRSDSSTPLRQMLNKVPEVTIYFWLIKILCTTVGETAADLLNENLGLGLTNTSYVMAALLIVTLVFQFRARRYIPGIYWLAVVLISVVGTLISDNLTDNYGVTLETTTTVFASCLAIVFISWYAVEKTLSIHSIVTTRREGFYWLAILFTFALGTSAGDLTAERLELGFLVSVGLFAGLILAVTVAHARFKLNAVLSFWIAYILTRPLGASIGDFLSQPRKDGGQGLGTIATSCIFLAAILGFVIYLTRTRRDLETVTVELADSPSAVAPACPSCGAPLPDELRLALAER